MHVSAVPIIDALLEACPPYAAQAPVFPVAQPDVAHIVELYGVLVQQLVHRHAACHAFTKPLQTPRSIAVEIVHDTLEDVVGQFKKHAVLGHGDCGLGGDGSVESDGAAFATGGKVGHVGREVVQVVQAE